MKRLEKKFKTKTILNVVVEQICMLRKTFVVCENKIFFLKNREKKLFDKNLFVVEKFEHLKKFKKNQ